MIKVKKVLKGVTVIDLFAGIGGFHQACSSFGAKIIYASEWDKDAAKVYKENYKLAPAGDITKIDASEVPDHNIACLGFPCQPFSISGNQGGFEDSRGTLFFDAARIIKEKQPEVVIVENVKNLVTHDDGRTFKVIMNTLDEIGYNAFAEVLDAADYGVPQSRKRIYIVCFRKNLGIENFEFPKPLKLKKHISDILQSDAETSKYVINRTDIVMREDTEPLENNRPLRVGTVNKGGQGERIYSPKGTGITLSAYGGGVGAKTGLYLVNGNVRKLSPRECARLDGFPDTFKLDERDSVCYKQFGNSVVIDVLQYIINEITKKDEVMKIWQCQGQK